MTFLSCTWSERAGNNDADIDINTDTDIEIVIDSDDCDSDSDSAVTYPCHTALSDSPNWPGALHMTGSCCSQPESLQLVWQQGKVVEHLQHKMKVSTENILHKPKLARGTDRSDRQR